MLHAIRLASLGLRELRGDDDQAEVDHEERTDLPHHHIVARACVRVCVCVHVFQNRSHAAATILLAF